MISRLVASALCCSEGVRLSQTQSVSNYVYCSVLDTNQSVNQTHQINHNEARDDTPDFKYQDQNLYLTTEINSCTTILMASLFLFSPLRGSFLRHFMENDARATNHVWWKKVWIEFFLFFHLYMTYLSHTHDCDVFGFYRRLAFVLNYYRDKIDGGVAARLLAMITNDS